jgi:hypothetical protein
MTIALELLGGPILASALIAFARWRRAEDRIFAVVLAITAAYYVVHAIGGGTREDLLLELLGLALFGAFAVLGFLGRRWWLAFGWAAHAGWDVGFHTGGRGGYVPEWYPMLCVGFDLFLSGFIVGLALLRERRSG